MSDVTGATKTAKYYRIPLPSDSLPYDILDNPLKGAVRLYCRIVGDRFELAPVVRQVSAGVDPLQIIIDGSTVNKVFTEILFHLYTRSNGGQTNNTTVKFTI